MTHGEQVVMKFNDDEPLLSPTKYRQFLIDFIYNRIVQRRRIETYAERKEKQLTIKSELSITVKSEKDSKGSCSKKVNKKGTDQEKTKN